MHDFLARDPIQSGPFQPTWESLRTFQCPDWFRDAKFGIWAHWGPQSVPMFGDWYARRMYEEGTEQYLHHWRTYGHPSRHGWKDIVTQWKAERFDPDALMQLYVAAGAKYFVAQAAHHDNFDNWHSRHHKWNAVNMGPKKNIVALWQAAARKRGLPFGVTEHLGATFSWWRFNKGADKAGLYAGVPYDGHDPACEDFYLPNKDEPANAPWYTENPWWLERWFKRIKDLIDQHQPDLLYSDGGVPFGEVGLHAIAHLYNTSAKAHGGVNHAVYNQKDKHPDVAAVGVFDIERGQMDVAAPSPWQTDTCVAGWFYDIRAKYKTPHQIVETLVDIVSKNGNLLLNFTQRPDGTLDEECTFILKRLAAWNRVNSEGIHGTRPWNVVGEGPSSFVQSARFKEDAVEWTTADFRFTAKGKAVYAFQMRYSDRREAFIRSLGLSSGHNVAAVQVLGAPSTVVSRQLEDGLLVQLPADPVCEFVPCIKVTLV
jgi:alpha-L-fucosidase